jgi:nucleoside-diphosphate-sugar epimerase
MDSNFRDEMGWNNVRSLEDGISSTYEHWLASQT